MPRVCTSLNIRIVNASGAATPSSTSSASIGDIRTCSRASVSPGNAAARSSANNPPVSGLSVATCKSLSATAAIPPALRRYSASAAAVLFFKTSTAAVSPRRAGSTSWRIRKVSANRPASSSTWINSAQPPSCGWALVCARHSRSHAVAAGSGTQSRNARAPKTSFTIAITAGPERHETSSRPSAILSGSIAL